MSSSASKNSIAIVGMALRVPGANNVEEFWENLCLGKESITFSSDDALRSAGTPDWMFNMDNFVRAAGILEDAEMFDASFFDISPQEARLIDPQHRVFLETAWETLERAGYSPSSFPGSIAVFAGCCLNDYAATPNWSDRTESNTPSIMSKFMALLGADKDYLSTRVSYKLNLKGPSMTIQTACSTSLVAVHMACQSLLLGECDLALAGGVSIRPPQETGYPHTPDMIFSADGHTHTFDSKATGTVFTNGVGIVALKRLEDAIADQDHIVAIIRGSAINNDGSAGKAAFSAPSLNGQAEVIAEALEVAEVNPATITYLEAHGTATILGDPIEVSALTKVFRSYTGEKQYCGIGSVKSNIGHPVHASGVVGLIKTALMLKHKKLVSSINFESPNPQIDFENSPFYVVRGLQDWKAGSAPRRGGVSSFGVGGTNSHVIVEEPPEAVRFHRHGESTQILKLSAKTPTALKNLAGRFAAHFNNPNVIPEEVCFTANTGRSDFDYRLAITGFSCDDFKNKLTRFVDRTDVSHSKAADHGRPLKIGFLFTGQGSQYVGMGRKLYERESTFRDAMNRCDEILAPLLEQRLLSILYPSSTKKTSELDQTLYTQPALFALEYSLARLWRSWGIEPDVLLGHSIGEYVAACVAGVFPLEQALTLVTQRAKMMNDLTAPGDMVAVFADPDTLSEHISKSRETISIAAINAPDLCVLSGNRNDLFDVLGILESKQIHFKRLNVSHAFHSDLMEPMLDPFEKAASAIEFSLPQKCLISNLNGKIFDHELRYNAAYLRRHIRETVQFTDCIKTMEQQNCDFVIEIGPHPVLSDLARRQISESPAVFLPSLNRELDDSSQILTSLARLYEGGAQIDWNHIYDDKKTGRVELPSYPFERKLFRNTPTIDTFKRDTPAPVESMIHPLLGRRIESPLSEVQFQVDLNIEELPFLQDHKIHNRIVFPAAGYIEMMVAAAHEMEGSERSSFHEIVFREPLFLDKGSHMLQLIWKPLDQGRASIEIFYRLETGWKLFVSAEYRPPADNQNPIDSLAMLASRCSEPMEIDEFYARKVEIGIHHGPAFQGVQALWKGNGEALGKVQLPQTAIQQNSLNHYFVHPSLIDSCLQVKETAIERSRSNRRLYLPVIIENIRVHRSFTPVLWAWARRDRMAQSNLDIRTIDISAMDEAGNLLLEIESLHLKTANPAVYAQPQTEESNQFYEIEWKEVPLSAESSRNSDRNPPSWLVLYEDRDRAQTLIEKLNKMGEVKPVFISSVTSFENDEWSIAPGGDEFEALLKKIAQDPKRQLIYLCGANRESNDSIDRVDDSLQIFVRLTRSIASSTRPTVLWVVTRGAQQVAREVQPITLSHSPLWGMGKVIPREQPDFQCRLIDLDPNDSSCDQLADEILEDCMAEQVAFRNRKRYRSRIIRKKISKSSAQSIDPAFLESYKMVVNQPGLLDSIAPVPSEAKEPGPEEVVIRVKATGLNFRDVLIALGRFNGPVGFECSGTIASKGSRVKSFDIGDEVFCVASEALSSEVCVDQRFVMRKPENVTIEEAAGIALPFLTADHALNHCANLRKGERVLIHAAAGGVGIAAVQIAKQIGAEIFATASKGKWDYLKSLGIKHILNSRTLEFTDYIREQTQGKGVDVVLNSLADEFITASVSILSEQGRFVEIGATNILPTEEFLQRKPHASYFAFHLRDVANSCPEGFQDRLRDIVRGLESGETRVLPTQIFAIGETVQAFRHMAQAKHIGKIVISHQPDGNGPNRFRIRADASYLITGGLGSLGLFTAQWLAEKGAKHVVLLGRHQPSVEAQDAIHNLEQKGTSVHVWQADVTSFEQMKGVMEQIERSMPSLKGVWHAAGTLSDAFLVQQSTQKMRKVTTPKIHGAWNLHLLTRQMNLDYFVLFSSMSALMGAQGQTTYAAANAFLDGFAHFRRNLGLPATSINWGSWGGGGMAVALDDRIKADRFARGLLELLPADGLKRMEEALQNDLTQIIIGEIDWNKFMLQETIRDHYFFNAFSSQIRKTGPQKKSTKSPVTQFLLSPNETDIGELIRHLNETVAKTLGIDPSEMSSNNSLTSLGVDSLMSIELSNRIQNSIGVHVPMVVFLKGLTIEQLAAELLERLKARVTAGSDVH